MALAVAMALGLSACGGGGGGGGNVRSSVPSSPSSPTNPTNPTNPAFTGGELDVAAGQATTVADTVTGNTGIIKGGAGTLTLTGTNSYTGQTQVISGALYVDGDQSAATGATSVSTAATLGGAGTLGGDVNVGAGATLAPGANGAIGTLTIKGSLNLSSTSLLSFDFAQASGGTQASDLINVKGNLTLGGTLDVNVASGGDLGPGVHRLINYDGTLVDNGLALGTSPSSHWLVQTGIAHQVNLVDTSGMSFSFWDGAGPKQNGVIDGGNGTWMAGGPDSSWTDAGGTLNTQYTNGSFAVFQGTPGTVDVYNGNGAVTAAGMQFASDGYIIQGDPIQLVGSASDPASSIFRVGDGTRAGARFTATINSDLSGNTALVKTDAGTLILGGNDTYTGGTTISGGTLQVGNGDTGGSIIGDVTDNGALAFNRSDDVGYAGRISGSGTLAKSGAGTLTLIGQNTFTGGTFVKGGTLALDLGALLGSGDITVGNADDGRFDPVSTLQVRHGIALQNHILVQGTGVVDNTGTIGGNVNIGVDSPLSNAGVPTVFNHDGGHIAGNDQGVSLNNAQGLVANSGGGLIEGGNFGIALSIGGKVTNDGAGSIIRSIANTGISSGTGGGSIWNTGGASILAGADAIALGGAGGVTNDGAGSLIQSQYGTAIDVIGGPGNVTNTGGATINSLWTTIYLGRGGSVTNGAGSTIQSNQTGGGGCAGVGSCAIVVPTGGGSMAFSNAGTIFGNVQMDATTSNSVTLSAGGVIHGDLAIGTGDMTLEGRAGVTQSYSQAVLGATTFSGRLTGPVTGTWVIDNDDLNVTTIGLNGGTLQIGSGGTAGSVGAGAYVSIYHGRLVFDRSDDITFNGSISSQHSEAYDGTLVQAGTGKLTLPLVDIGSSYARNDISPSHILIERGTLQIDNTSGQPGAPTGNAYVDSNIINNGSLIFDSSLRIDAGVISGTGSVTQNGSAELVLAGNNTYTGGTTINGGSLLAKNALAGDLTVNQAGTLDGYSGATLHPGIPGIGGNLSNAGKIFVHGGDTVVGGNYGQSSTGTLALSLGSKLSVAGAATLSGGTLEIIGADTGYVANNHTAVVTAAQGLTGTFDQLVKDTGVVFTATTVSYDGHSAWLDTTGLDVTMAASGQGVNYTRASSNSAQRVQGAFTQLNHAIATGNEASASPGFMQAAGEFQQAPTLQAAQASLQSLSGQLHAASAAMTFEAIDVSGRALAEHFDSVLGTKAGYGTWTQNLNAGGGMSRAGFTGVGFQLNGWLVGNDRQIGSSGVAGFAFGQSQGQQQLDQSADRNRSRSTEGMLYAGWLNGNWYTQGRIGFGHFQQDVSRRLLLGTNAEGVATNYSGDYNVAYGESGLHLDWGGTRVMPFANVEYARIDRDGFAEQGAGGFGLRTNAQVIDRWQAGLGMRAAHHWNLDGGRGIDFTAGAQFRRTFASHGDVFDASFVGLPQWQALTGVGLSRYSGVLNLGLDAALSARTSLKIGYDYQKGQRDQAQTLSAHWIMAL